MIVGYGPSSNDAFASYDPATSSWRTSQDSLWGEEWTRYSEGWPTSGMTVSGRAFRRRPLVPRTSVTGSGSSLTGKETHHVPTPTAQDFIERESTSTETLNFETNKSVSLDRWYWKTPTAAPSSHGGGGGELHKQVTRRERWPTPTSRDHKDGQYNPNVPVNGLRGRAVWRTPQARDGDQRGTQDPKKRKPGGHSVGLDDQVGGALNPTWVEWLMGFPLGWTDLRPSEMPWSRRSSNGSAAASSKPKG